MGLSLSIPEFLKTMAGTYAASQEGLQAGQQRAAAVKAATAQQARENAFKQQQINISAQAQAATQRNEEAQRTMAQQQADAEAYRNGLSVLSNPALTDQLSTTPIGRAQLNLAHHIVNTHGAKYGWPTLPENVDFSQPNALDTALGGPQPPPTGAAGGAAAAPPTAPVSAPPTAAGLPAGFVPSPVRGTPLPPATPPDQPADANLPPGVAGPQPPPGSVRTDQGTQIPATLPPGVAGPQPPPGSVRTSGGTQIPSATAAQPTAQAAAAPSGVSVGAVPPPLASVGDVPPSPPAAKGQPTAAAQAAAQATTPGVPAPFQVAPPNVPQEVPGAPAVPGLPDFTPAAKALLSFDPRAEVDQLRAKFPNLSLGAAQKMTADNLGMLRQAAQGSEDASLFPYKVLQAGLTAGLTDAQIQNTLANAGYTLQKPQLEQMKMQLQQKLAAGKSGLEAQKFQETQRHNQAEEANTAQRNVLTGQAQANTLTNQQSEAQQRQLAGVQRAAQINNQQMRQQIMALRGHLPLLRRDAWEEANKVVVGGNANVNAGANTPWGRLGGSIGGMMRDSLGRTLPDTPATRAYYNALSQIEKISSQPGAFVPGSYQEFDDVKGRLTPNDKAMIDASLGKGYEIRDPTGKGTGTRMQFGDLFNALKAQSPSLAIRLIRAYNQYRPGKPLPGGISIADAVAPDRFDVQPTAAAKPATAPPPASSKNQGLGPIPWLGRQPNSGSQPGEPLGTFGVGGLSQ